MQDAIDSITDPIIYSIFLKEGRNDRWLDGTLIGKEIIKNELEESLRSSYFH